jgi:hypothetical protein
MMRFLRLLPLLLALSSVAAFGADRFWEEEFPVTAGARLELESFKGKITLRTDEGSTVRVQARIYADQGTRPELVDFMKIEAQARASYVELSAEFDQGEAEDAELLGKSWSQPAVDWDITLPDHMRLELESHKSELDLRVPSGSIEIESHKGEGAIRGVRGPFELETHKGEFEVVILELDNVEVETHKGNIELEIHGARDFELSGESHKGDLIFEGREVRVEDDDGETFVEHREGDGSRSIELETHEGKIRVRFVG